MSKEISLLTNAIPKFRGNESPSEIARICQDCMQKQTEGLQYILQNMEDTIQKQADIIAELKKGI